MTPPVVVILLGPPGVGKGTQGVLIEDATGWERVVTGDLLRRSRREGTPLGARAARYMDAGELVPDPLIVALVEERLRATAAAGGLLFDGFPRTVPQAVALGRVFDDLGWAAGTVLFLNAPEEELVRRMSGRRSCPACGAVYNVHFSPPPVEGRCGRCGRVGLIHRPDDSEETVLRRLEVYRAETEPLLRHYRDSGAKVVEVDGSKNVDEVRAAVVASLGVAPERPLRHAAPAGGSSREGGA